MSHCNKILDLSRRTELHVNENVSRFLTFLLLAKNENENIQLGSL